MMARARPSDIAVPTFASSRASSSTSAPWVPVMAKPLSQFFLSELFGFVKSYHHLLRPKGDAVHCMHSGCGCILGTLWDRQFTLSEAIYTLVWRLVRDETESTTFSIFVTHNACTVDCSVLLENTIID